MASYGLDPATNGAPSADPDGDDFNNKFEFFLGGNPTQADNTILPTSHPATSGPTGIVFEFDRLQDASSVAYVVEYAPDLSNSTTWTSAAVNGVGQNGATVGTGESPRGSNFDHITVTIPTNAERIFVRLRL